MNKAVISIILFTLVMSIQASNFSTAGFFKLENSGREAYNMNIGWRFFKGPQSNADKIDFDDSSWTKTSLPHGLEILPEEASGGINYQGEAWYRKHFVAPDSLKEKKIFLHFEAIMGKSKIWVNGNFLKEHLGGYLPVIVDVTDYLIPGKDNVISVWADNSDDPAYPPGKPQASLDFVYFGGIYRDCWLVVHDKLHITDANYENETGGGGLFVHYPQVTEDKATISLSLHLRNENTSSDKGDVIFRLKNREGKIVVQQKESYSIRSGRASYVQSQLRVNDPEFWCPATPYLYDLEIEITNGGGKIIDGYKKRIGIRSIEFKGQDGFWLNGKPYEEKLVGVNRHQDFALIGNALPNSLHWRDVKKLKDAGISIIRSAHYPQDPAFMDACNELGVFVIVATPGWQFWSNEPIFAERIYHDIRNIVRRDRNHPSLFFWEPVLNETHFPEEFALQAKKCVEEEYPYSGGNYVAIDPGSKGSKHYPVIYSHPQSKETKLASVYTAGEIDPDKVYFTREFGDNVDDWNSHNSNSRVHRSWGEEPMLIQAHHYANPPYPATSLEAIYSSEKYHIGGTLWHSFDHQRGYHPQAFYGGIMDAYRQPKISYYMFMTQRSAENNLKLSAMLYIAHELTPFSSKDVTVFSNCEEVRLTVFEGGKQYTFRRSDSNLEMPSPIITFQDAFDFMALKALSRAGKQDAVFLLAEGIVDGKVVVSEKKYPSRRPTKIRLSVDDNGMKLKTGSDIVTVIAEITDDNGVVKRLNNYMLRFSVEGEGVILGNSQIGTNPIHANWGSAPVLIQSTHIAGDIKIKAEMLGNGINMPSSAEIVINTQHSSGMNFIYNEHEVPSKDERSSWQISGNEKMIDEEIKNIRDENTHLKKVLNEYRLKEVDKQQEIFGE